MGKGTIKSGGTDGLYQLTIKYNRDKYERTIAVFNQKISALENQITETEASVPTIYPELGTVQYPTYNAAMNKVRSLKMQKIAVEKQKSYLENHFPEDSDISAWCADYSENIAGDVVTIEVPGEVGTIQIAPAYDETNPDTGAAYVSSAGKLMPSVICSPAQAYGALALLPGYQKWKPTFRYGTITSKDDDANTASVTLEAILSSQQSLVINQTETLDNVTFDYMDCNSLIFEVDDSVLIKFTGQNWANPVIIGYKDNPKPCATEFLIVKVETVLDRVIVVNCVDGNLAEKIPDGSGGYLTFPCTFSALSYWIGHSSEITQENYWTKTIINIPVSEYGYTKPNVPISGSESRFCGGDELVTTWEQYAAFFQGYGYCFEAIVDGVESTHFELNGNYERFTYYYTDVSAEDAEYPEWIGNPLTEGAYSETRMNPKVPFDDSASDSEIKITNGWQWEYCFDQGGRWSIDPVVKDETGRFQNIDIAGSVISTTKSCFQMFATNCTTVKYLENVNPDYYPEDVCFWMINGVAYDPNMLVRSGPTQVVEPFIFTGAIDYRRDGLIDEGFDPKTSIANSVINNFISQCASDAPNITVYNIAFQFRTLN